MRYIKALNLNILEQERGACLEEVPCGITGKPSMTQRFGGPRVRVDRHAESAAEHFQTCHVIAMFMRDQNAIEACGGDPGELEPLRNLTRAKSGINEDPALACSDQSAIASTTAAKDRQTKHGG